MRGDSEKLIQQSIVFIFITSLCIISGRLLYICFGHQLIGVIYNKGKSIGSITKGQTVYLLEYYFKKVDSFFSQATIYSLFTLFLSGILLKKRQLLSAILLKEKHELSLFIKRNTSLVQKNKKIFLSILALFIIFYSLYSATSFLLAKSSVFNEFNILFQADTPRVINDITIFSSNHCRTKVHPIYVLLVNPFGLLLRYLTGSKVASAIIINSFLGTCGVILAFLFFWLLSKNYINSLILSIIFGLSVSQFFISSDPETFSLAICSLMITYILFLISLQKKRLYLSLWILAGIFSLGVTTTNFIQTLICLMVTAVVIPKKETKEFSTAFQILAGAGIATSVTIYLSIFQKIIYPSSSLFFLPRWYLQESAYASLMIIQQPLTVGIQIIKHFFLVNFIAPRPDIFAMPQISLPAITFSSSWNYTLVGWAGVALWLFFFVGGLVKSLFWEQKNFPFFIGVLLCLLFNILLHCFYGIGEKGRIELFIYTANFSFLVLLFLSDYSLSKNIFIRILLILLGILIGINNVMVMRNILAIYKV